MGKLKSLLCLFAVIGFGLCHEQKRVIDIEEIQNSSSLIVHLEGAVNSEGEYTVSNDQTIKDLLDQVGLLNDAELSCLNMNRKLEHEMIIYVPYKKENLISLNNASFEELQTIDGIGPTKAQAIIDARPFESLEDLMNVKGIGEKSYRKYREYVCL